MRLKAVGWRAESRKKADTVDALTRKGLYCMCESQGADLHQGLTPAAPLVTNSLRKKAPERRRNITRHCTYPGGRNKPTTPKLKWEGRNLTERYTTGIALSWQAQKGP